MTVLCLPDPMRSASMSRLTALAAALEGLGIRAIVYVDPEVQRTRRFSGATRFVPCDPDVVAVEASAALRVIEREQPQCVVTDFLLGSALAARALRVPHVTVSNASLTRHYRGDVLPAPDHPFAGFVRRLPRRLGVGIVRIVQWRKFRADSRAYAKVAGVLNVAPPDSLFDLFEGDLTVIPEVTALATMAPLPATCVMVGPFLPAGLPPVTAPSGCGLLLAFGDHPTPGLIGRVVRQARALGRRLYALEGPWLEGIRDARLVRLREQEAAGEMTKLQAALYHGGTETTYRLLALGLPLLGLPQGAEHEWSLAAVRRAGVGARLEPARIAQMLAPALAAVGAGAVRRRTLEIANAIRQSPGAVGAARVLQGWLKASASREAA